MSANREPANSRSIEDEIYRVDTLEIRRHLSSGLIILITVIPKLWDLTKLDIGPMDFIFLMQLIIINTEVQKYMIWNKDLEPEPWKILVQVVISPILSLGIYIYLWAPCMNYFAKFMIEFLRESSGEIPDSMKLEEDTVFLWFCFWFLFVLEKILSLFK